VAKDCARDELLVRARRKGDIEKLFPKAKVRRDPRADYLFRAPVKKTEIAAALANEVNRVTYSNFKDSVKDDDLHTAYLKTWSALGSVQDGFDLWPKSYARDYADMALTRSSRIYGRRSQGRLFPGNKKT
jgi:hypothetical protein